MNMIISNKYNHDQRILKKDLKNTNCEPDNLTSPELFEYVSLINYVMCVLGELLRPFTIY